MSPDTAPAPMSQSQALDAAGNDADANAGQGNVGDPVVPCPLTAAQVPTPEPTPQPTPVPTPAPTPTPPPMAPLWVRLDLTEEEAAAESGSLRLVGSTAGYDRTIAIAGNFEANPDPDNTVDVQFENVPTSDSYSLTYIGGDGTETAVVQGAPFDSLTDNAGPAQDQGEQSAAPEEQG